MIHKHLFITLTLFTFFTSIIFPYQLTLKHPKDSDHSLSSSFLQEIAAIFKADVFVESGTYYGNTTAKAIPFFKEVHSIELSPIFYNSACQRFKNNPSVNIHLGNSSQVLASLLPFIQGKIVFWLDGHYSEGNTAKGDKNTPLLDEIEAIRITGIKNAIIVIDDIRQFQQVPDLPHNAVLQGYPSVKELRDAIMTVNENYIFTIYGDMAIAFDKNEDVTLSPVLAGCTISRMLEDATDLTFLNTVLQAEEAISLATGFERDALLRLPEFFKHSEIYHGLGKYFYLWSGLIYKGLGDTAKALKEFERALELGCFKEHISHYLP